MGVVFFPIQYNITIFFLNSEILNKKINKKKIKEGCDEVKIAETKVKCSGER